MPQRLHSSFNLGARWGVGGQRHAPTASPTSLVPIIWEARWGPRQVWTDAGNLAPTGVRPPDCPARGKSLYRLSYPGPRYPLQV